MRRIRNTRLGLRLGISFAITAILMCAMMVVSVLALGTQQRHQQETVDDLRLARTFSQLEVLAAEFEGSQIAYAFEADLGRVDATEGGESRKAFEAATGEFEALLGKAADLEGAAEVSGQLQAMRQAFEEFMTVDRDIVTKLRSADPADRARAVELTLGAEVETFERITGAAHEAVTRAEQRADAAGRAGDQGKLWVIAFGLLALGLAGALATLITRSVARPLAHVVDVIDQVADGDLSTRVVDGAQDEVGQMGRALNGALDRMAETVHAISRGSQSLAAASEEVSAVSRQMNTSAEEVAAQAGTVSAAAEEVSSSIRSVSVGTEELTSSIQEIAQNTGEAAGVATAAVEIVESTTDTVNRLGASSAQIGQVVKVITSIAEQTNLLALNATIEAARAGDAGKGFAVVAKEVKDLARKTAHSTEEIAARIEAIQTDTEDAVAAMVRITGVIREIHDTQTVIAAAVEEQAATANEIGRASTEVASGAAEIAENITGVAGAARENTQSAAETFSAASELARLATGLQELVGQFTLPSDRPEAAPPSARPLPSPRAPQGEQDSAGSVSPWTTTRS